MTHGEKAEALFYEGYNCSQSVLLAFSDVTGLEERTAAMLASSFGGGLGRLREVCGAVSGGAMVLGLVCGYSDPKDAQAKRGQTARSCAASCSAVSGRRTERTPRRGRTRTTASVPVPSL